MPSVVIPIKELVKICREENVEQIFVDGAHAIGCGDVDMKENGADFYTSNLHKWLFCPPSVADYVYGLAIESGCIANRDYSSQLVVRSVLEFVSRFEGGIEGIKKQKMAGSYNKEAGDTEIACKKLQSGSLELAVVMLLWQNEKVSVQLQMDNGSSLRTGDISMAMVGLPASLGISNELDALKLRTHLRDRFHVEVPLQYEEVKHGEIGNRNQDGGLITRYARFSHQVYDNAGDYEKIRDTIIQLVRGGFTCNMLYPS
ncbi:hypothetical protein C5167_021938 [Papaver somniferum]|uniref:Aminotransferase class V domain-containing protein n=1 Tax=Papaver somniferum TaxID=3469 RepID=A0A4Y7JJJ1_PAPSO|nr:hypothetical protein C5167_021938 [Papaver somniferum]